jgi:ubiquinone/menaquinone biosynthesis C-methylase UbiE
MSTSWNRTRAEDRGVPSLGEAWEAQAEEWTRWAREPQHDSYWRFHRAALLRLVPTPGRLTLDLGCGEGRVSRDLKASGHRVVGFDVAPTMARYAHDTDPTLPVLVADAVALPLADLVADLAVAFMSLHDMDDLDGALREVARVLVAGGRLCIAVVHPINSAGAFASADPDASFRIDDYVTPRRYVDRIERDAVRMTFHSVHRPIEVYAEALVRAGFLIETMREIAVPEEAVREPPDRRWQRVPMFLHMRAQKHG